MEAAPIWLNVRQRVLSWLDLTSFRTRSTASFTKIWHQLNRIRNFCFIYNKKKTKVMKTFFFFCKYNWACKVSMVGVLSGLWLSIDFINQMAKVLVLYQYKISGTRLWLFQVYCDFKLHSDRHFLAEIPASVTQYKQMAFYLTCLPSTYKISHKSINRLAA